MNVQAENNLSSSGFTLVELLVVVAIIALMASLLMPTLSGARERARVAVCMSNQRQMGAALTLYASEYGHYPTNYERTTRATSHNWFDECATVWGKNPPPFVNLIIDGTHNTLVPSTRYYPDQSDAFPDIPGIQNSAWHRFAAAGYADYDEMGYPTSFSLCTATLPSSGFLFFGGQVWAPFGLYFFNGEQSNYHAVRNNSVQSGMYLMGRFKQGMLWGNKAGMETPASHGTNSWTSSDIAMLGCPTIGPQGNSTASIMFEPHGRMGASPFGGQFDVGFQLQPSVYKYGRNYLFADLHGEYIQAETRESIHQ